MQLQVVRLLTFGYKRSTEHKRKRASRAKQSISGLDFNVHTHNTRNAPTQGHNTDTHITNTALITHIRQCIVGVLTHVKTAGCFRCKTVFSMARYAASWRWLSWFFFTQRPRAVVLLTREKSMQSSEARKQRDSRGEECVMEKVRP